MKYILLCITLAFSLNSWAQDQKTAGWSFSGYLEAYYSYDVNKPVSNSKASFLYSYNRNNEVNINLGFIKAGYIDEHMRSNIALATGTYMNANYAAEQGVLKNVYEANVGLKLSRKHNLWLDAGILPSHIGWEGATGKDYSTLSRSLAAENSPYFETGVKIGYTSKNEKWYLSALLLNGWQRIQRIDGNTTPAFGTQITFKASADVTVNSSTFIGNDKPDSIRQMRYFHDLYATFQLPGAWSLIAGFDIGFEQKRKGAADMNCWYTPTMIVRYAPGRFSMSGRGEYFDDSHAVIIATGAQNGCKIWGYSANIDYKISDHMLWRLEVRNLYNHDAIFQKQTVDLQRNSLVFNTAIAIGF